MEYRNITTGELAPAHHIGKDTEGRPLYQQVDGWEPLFLYEADHDGNWVFLAQGETTMKKEIVRWEAKWEDRETIRFALRTEPKGKGIEIGAYTRWDNAKAYEASEPIAIAIEEKARNLGYEIGEDEWNDLVDYDN